MPGDKWAQYADQPSTDKWAQYADQSTRNVQIGPSWQQLGTSMLQTTKDAANDLYTGGVKEFGQGIATISSGLNRLPWIGEKLAPQIGVQSFKSQMQPDNATQKVGGALEQTGEMALTGGPIKSGAEAILPRLPWLARIGAEAVNVGGNAALHGQSPTAGAIVGAGTEGLGQGLQAVAPKLAESALGVTGKMRGRGRTIGQSVLDETQGVRPATIAASAGQQIGNLNQQLESAANASNQTASTAPAHQALNQAIANAPRNAQGYIQKLQSLRPLLDFGNSAQQTYTPAEILEMKRGIGTEMKTWEPQLRKTAAGVQQQLYGALDSELDRTVPGAQQLNQRMSSLIPAKQRAQTLMNAAPLSQRMAGRMMAHTGALTAGAFGAKEGYDQGGIPGAIGGGVAGTMIPEMLASPTGQMIAARAANNPVVLPWLRGLMLQGVSEESKPQY